VLEIKPDLRLLGFTLGVTMLTGLLFGLAPAILATRPDLIPALKNDVVVVVGGSRRWELRRWLVILQVALSLVLLVGAGLFVRSLRNLKAVDAGYNADQVVMLSLDPAQSGYQLDPLRSFYVQLNERVAALPGVKSVTHARNVPISGRIRESEWKCQATSRARTKRWPCYSTRWTRSSLPPSAHPSCSGATSTRRTLPTRPKS